MEKVSERKFWGFVNPHFSNYFDFCARKHYLYRRKVVFLKILLNLRSVIRKEHSNMLTYISLPPSPTERRLSFYLAMEEYVAQHLKQLDECFFLWQVNPTVIIGRNQVMENEVNLPYCREHGIDIVRRKSGGGGVYADKDNVMFSFICSRTHDATTPEVFSHYLQRTVDLLSSFGVEACVTDHNDILIGERKVSGWAVYQLQERIIVHGTMLYDTNMNHMVASITPPAEKLQRKGVESVRQRICLLKDYIGDRINIDEFKVNARDFFCDDREYILTQSDVACIEELSGEYEM